MDQTRPLHSMYGVSMILAPLLQAASTFFWISGEYGITGGTLLVFSMIFWIPSLIVLFSLVKVGMPNYAAWGLLIAIYGFISGVGFAFTGIYAEMFTISHEKYIHEFSKHPLVSDILLFQAGPLAPLSLVVLAIVLLKTKKIKTRIALLILLGGIAFPLSRISRTSWVAHVADIILMVPLAEMGFRILLGRQLLR